MPLLMFSGSMGLGVNPYKEMIEKARATEKIEFLST